MDPNSSETSGIDTAEDEAMDAAAPEDPPQVADDEPVVHYLPEYLCDSPWTLICQIDNHEDKDCSIRKQRFFKGCKWSPDGTCLLTCSADDVLRLFDLPADLYNSHKKAFQGCTTTQLSPSLKIKEGELIYDYCWHPQMSSWQADTCL